MSLVKTLLNVVQEVPDNITQVKILFNVVLILLGQNCTGKTLSNVVQETLNNISQVKILFNYDLIPLRQHCTGKNFVQCCSKGSWQHCIEKNSVEYCLNTLGINLHR